MDIVTNKKRVYEVVVNKSNNEFRNTEYTILCNIILKILLVTCNIEIFSINDNIVHIVCFIL